MVSAVTRLIVDPLIVFCEIIGDGLQELSAKISRLTLHAERVRVKQAKDDKASEASKASEVTGTEATGNARARRKAKKDR